MIVVDIGVDTSFGVDSGTKRCRLVPNENIK